MSIAPPNAADQSKWLEWLNTLGISACGTRKLIFRMTTLIGTNTKVRKSVPPMTFRRRR